jgi:alpha-beta hydrolase superfamily lysophospholipase
MVASAPLFGLPNKPVPRIVARPVAKVLSCLALGKLSTGVGTHDKPMFETNALTHDFDMYALARNSPYRIPSARFGWVNATFDAVNYIHQPANLSKLSAPTLVFLGSEESVVEPIGITNWVTAAHKHAKVDVRLDMIHGARHELFSEIPKYRDQVINKTRAWLKTFLE